MKFKKIKRPKIRIRRPRVRIRWQKRNSKWVIGIVMFFFAALFAFQLVLMNYAKSILQNILSLQIAEVAGGIYTSSFDDIEISYTNRSLTIKNLLLVPQQEKDKKVKQDDTFSDSEIYKIFIPEVNINDINLRKAFVQNYLEIGSIELERPEFIIQADFDDPENQTASILKKDLYKLLPERIKEFQVRTVRINDGVFSVNGKKNDERNSIRVSPFQLEFSNFHLSEGSAGRTDKIFFTDDFFLEADSIGGSLSNDSYGFSMQSLKVSSADSSAFARNIKLYPNQGVPAFMQDSSISKIYEFNFPQVYVYGLSINQLYHSKDLIAGEVTVLGPAFNLINLKPLSPGQKENFRPENLFPVIDKVLNSIQVKNLLLRNGMLNISEFKPSNQEKLNSEIVQANIKNFVLDSNARFNNHKLLYSDEINFKLQNYSLRLSDNLHLFQARELNFSSEKSQISAEGFRIIPDSLKLNSISPGIMYAANVASIRMDGVDLLHAYNNNILNIDSLWLQQPSLKLVRNNPETKNRPPTPSKEKGFHEEDLYVLIEDYLYSLNIDEIAVQKGQINIKNKNELGEDAFITNIRKAFLWNFRLDSASAYQLNKLFYANDFELEIENYEHELPDGLHRITADEIGISTLKDRIYITDLKIFNTTDLYPYLKLKSSNSKTLLNLNVPFLELDKVDILKAYLHKRLEVGNVNIPSPSIGLGTLLGKQTERSNLIKSSAIYEMMKGYLEVIKVENLQLHNGQLDLAFFANKDPLLISGRNTNIQVQNFRFDSLTSSNPKRLFFADNVKVKVEDFSTHLPDGIHIIGASKLYASTEQQEILAEEVSINTLKEEYSEEELLGQYGQQGYVRLELPKVYLTGVNFDKSYYQEHLKIDSVVAIQPDVRYTYLLNRTRKERSGSGSFHQTNYSAIAPFFQILEINSLTLESGRFSAIQKDGNNYLESTLLEGIELELDNYLLDSISTVNAERFLFADDIRIHIEKYQQELLDKIHTISARNLQLSTALQMVKAENIKLKPDSKKLRQLSNILSSSFKNRYIIDLPEIRLNGIGFDEVYRNGNLEIEELLLEAPDVNIRHYVQESDFSKKKNKKNNYDLSELIKGNLKNLKINSTRILNGQGEYTLLTGLSSPVFIEAELFNAQIDHFEIGGKETNQDKFLYADDVRFTLNGFERKLPDSLHLLKINELKISSGNNEIEAIGLHLSPRLDVNLIELMKEKEVNNLYDFQVPRTRLSGIDIKRFQKDSLVLQNLLWENSELRLFSFPYLLDKNRQEGEGSHKNFSAPFLKGFRVIQADSISLKNADMKLVTINDKHDSSYVHLPFVDGLATNFKIDSTATTPTSYNRLFFSERLQFQVRDYTSLLDNDLYKLKINKILLDTQGGKLEADSISLIPQVNRATFANIKGKETDQFTFRNRKLRVINFDYKALLESEGVIADSLLLDGFVLQVYRDKRQPFPENHYPKMPQEMIRNLKCPLFLKGFAIRNGYIGYEEQAKGARGTGFIDLTDINILGGTITNDSLLLAQGLITNISMESLLMGKGKLQAYFSIPLGDSLNRHHFHGNLDEMNLEEFNPILEKTVFIKIRSGQAEKINFYIEADKHMAKGNMDFQYSGLKVALVNKKSGKTGGPIKEIGSLLANWLVVNSNNLVEEEESFVKGEMMYERDERRSTVNYWVKTLVNGFKSSIGL